MLVVERDAGDGEPLCGLVRELGHEPVVATGGHAAVDRLLISDRRFDLVLLDAELRDLDGIEVLAQLRGHGGPHVPVIVFTPDSPGERRRAAESGADDIEPKPIDSGLLRARINHLLRLRASQEALEHKHERVRVLQQQQQQLTDLLVHDLKNPMSVVQANLEYVRSAVDAGDSELLEALDDGREASIRILRMIEDILLVSRLEQGEHALDLRPFALVPSLEHARRDTQREAGRKSLSVSLETAAEHLYVPADAQLLRRLLETLIETCVRHAPKAGKVSLEARVDGMAEIRIGCNGAPVPVEDRDSIFDKHGAGRDRGRAFGGTGLGLYLCRLVAEAHGGTIEVTETDAWPMLFVTRLPAG